MSFWGHPRGRCYTVSQLCKMTENEYAFAVEAHSIEDPELPALQIHRGDLHMALLEALDDGKI